MEMMPLVVARLSRGALQLLCQQAAAGITYIESDGMVYAADARVAAA